MRTSAKGARLRVVGAPAPSGPRPQPPGTGSGRKTVGTLYGGARVRQSLAMAAHRRKLDLRKTLFLLPNMITLSSIFCGFDSIRLSATGEGEDDFYRAALLIIFA